ncbi:hypothetical protein M0813_27074 [Anaeramoeba flamelloides]|uniref:histone acetyltransferase n=1 Tax=Anaeramoeba flamelloides TaxID=1746091 RepID=A0AAV8A1H7_9EUKA|nr:hypothetical protein M0812_07562 [Anaeramoeba flamelloides]KAJ6237512.1 hypothetical protein M0813_27074 [Anaeramoeba flamelloides]
MDAQIDDNTNENLDEIESEFVTVSNDGESSSLRLLIGLRNVFSVQLPNMPREYIAKIVLDKRHVSLLVKKNFLVLGGICFRPFPDQKIVEIVFLAVSSNHQQNGLGRKLMSQVKNYVQKSDIYDILTYADNKAVGYFQKQGFSKEITIPDERWKGYLKDYEGGVFMHCKLYPSVDYLGIAKMIQRQKQYLKRVCKNTFEVTNHKGLNFNGRSSIPISEIDGLKEIWDYEKYHSMQLKNNLRSLLTELFDFKFSWPFREPVDKDEVIDYYEVIEIPMDFTIMKKKLANAEYTSFDLFKTDVELIVNNCRNYNRKDTIFHKCAVNLEAFFQKKLKTYKFL